MEQLLRWNSSGESCSHMNRIQVVWGIKSRRDATECCSDELIHFCNLQSKQANNNKPTSEEILPTVSGDTSSSGARCIQVRSIRTCFYPGDGILEQASTHHTDYTKLNTALCQHRQEADQSADVRTERRSLPATGYVCWPVHLSCHSFVCTPFFHLGHTEVLGAQSANLTPEPCSQFVD